MAISRDTVDSTIISFHDMRRLRSIRAVRVTRHSRPAEASQEDQGIIHVHVSVEVQSCNLAQRIRLGDGIPAEATLKVAEVNLIDIAVVVEVAGDRHRASGLIDGHAARGVRAGVTSITDAVAVAVLLLRVCGGVTVVQLADIEGEPGVTESVAVGIRADIAKGLAMAGQLSQMSPKSSVSSSAWSGFVESGQLSGGQVLARKPGLPKPSLSVSVHSSHGSVSPSPSVSLKPPSQVSARGVVD